ncbi:hypothetical protein DFP72DRAFT_514691, partial [Ephemerocybe angulata]
SFPLNFPHGPSTIVCIPAQSLKLPKTVSESEWPPPLQTTTSACTTLSSLLVAAGTQYPLKRVHPQPLPLKALPLFRPLPKYRLLSSKQPHSNARKGVSSILSGATEYRDVLSSTILLAPARRRTSVKLRNVFVQLSGIVKIGTLECSALPSTLSASCSPSIPCPERWFGQQTSCFSDTILSAPFFGPMDAHHTTPVSHRTVRPPSRFRVLPGGSLFVFVVHFCSVVLQLRFVLYFCVKGSPYFVGYSRVVCVVFGSTVCEALSSVVHLTVGSSSVGGKGYGQGHGLHLADSPVGAVCVNWSVLDLC